MKNSRVTIRYAKALLGLALEEKEEKRVYNDMLLIKRTCVENKDFVLLLKSPIIKTDQKLKILEKIFSDNISRLSKLFVNIIAAKKRESLLKEIAIKFVELYKKHNNIEIASITTVNTLDESLREKVLQAIKKESKKEIELNEVVNEKIIGGAIIRIGDKQLDASVSNALNKLKNKFNKNLYIQDY